MWYVAPFLPSVLGVYGTVATKAMGVRPAAEIVERIGLPLAATLAFFGFVIWLNLRAARKLAARAKALEEALEADDDSRALIEVLARNTLSEETPDSRAERLSLYVNAAYDSLQSQGAAALIAGEAPDFPQA